MGAKTPVQAEEAAADEQDLIRPMQTILQENDCDVGTVNGQVGLRMREAVKALQVNHDTPITGRPSQTVLERLLARRPGGPSWTSPAVKEVSGPTIVPGSAVRPDPDLQPP